ncbi:MAG: BrnA antitoxin family protein [Deltaproteobacteria bacterium]|nr:BrnA antitoxin family protein [Deltaproteobacteria bacterium]
MKNTSKTDWPRLINMTEEEIEKNAMSDPDAALTDEKFWKNAEIVLPRKKVSVSIRLDAEVVEWFKQQGRPYQTLINSVLRTYVDHQKKGQRMET